MEHLLTRVLVVDDHLLTRLGAIAILSSQSDMMVCGEADCGVEAIRLHHELEPDVTVVDMRLPDFDGDFVIGRVRERNRNAAFLCLSTFDGEEEVSRALRAGALGYLLKDAGSAELLAAVRMVARGRTHIPGELAERISWYTAQQPLSPREREVLRLIAKGLANKEVAFELSIAEETAKTHVRNILSKLGVTDRTAAVVRAVELGVIQVESGLCQLVPRAGAHQ